MPACVIESPKNKILIGLSALNENREEISSKAKNSFVFIVFNYLSVKNHHPKDSRNLLQKMLRLSINIRPNELSLWV